MGSGSSKQDQTSPRATMTQAAAAQEEKYLATHKDASTAGETSQRSDSQLPTASAHASDRLHRIAAEAQMTLGQNMRQAMYEHDMPQVPAHDDMSATVTLEAINAWDSIALADPTSRMAALTLHDAAISKSCRRRRNEEEDIFVFSNEIQEALQRSNQKSSGRCWIFAALNMARIGCLRQLNVDEFELSESYLSFYDKLEKSNAFLEYMIERSNKPIEDSVIQNMMAEPAGDGGYWEMATNLIDKYGLVPKPTYPESYTSSNTGDVSKILNDKLREFALELRDMQKNSVLALSRAGIKDGRAGIYNLRKRKDEMMATVYRIMAITFGQPPKPDEKFTYQYVDKDGKFKTIACTPREFVQKYTGDFDTSKYTEMSGDPRYAEDRLIVVPNSLNVWGGKPAMWSNTNSKVMKEAVVKCIKAGVPVWFSNDVGQYRTESGVMDPDLFDYELPFSIKLGMTKKQKLETQSTQLTHAMLITGVHLSPEGEPIRFKVENSWGNDVGDRGFFVMTAAWFDLYAYTVVIRNDFAPKNLVKLFRDGPNRDSIVLPSSVSGTNPLISMADAETSASGAAAAAASAGDDEEDEAGEEEEEEYEIESILDHKIGALKKGEMAYLVSWKDYGEEHDSWVTEEDAVNCKEMLAEYWAKVDSLGTKKLNVGRKKRAIDDGASQRRSSRLSPSAQRSQRGKPSATAKEEMTRRRARIAGRANVQRAGVTHDDMNDDVKAIDDAELRRLEGEEREQQLRIIAAKRYMRLADWHDVVRRVETVEVESSKRLIAYIVFENGGRYAFDAAVANHRCPQKMLQFYESRLRFTPRAAELPPLARASAKGVDTDEREGEEATARETGSQEATEATAEQEGEGGAATVIAAEERVGDGMELDEEAGTQEEPAPPVVEAASEDVVVEEQPANTADAVEPVGAEAAGEGANDAEIVDAALGEAVEGTMEPAEEEAPEETTTESQDNEGDAGSAAGSTEEAGKESAALS